MHRQEVDYTGGHHYRESEAGGDTSDSHHLYFEGDSVEGQDLYFSDQPIHFLPSEKSEHLAQDLGEEQRFGGRVNEKGESWTSDIKDSSSEMSSKEFIQRRKWKLEERSASWDVLDTELHEDNGGSMVEVKLEKTEDNQHQHLNVILYKMEEDESRLWSEGHNLSRYSGLTTSTKSVEVDDRVRKVKLYRRAQSENLVSYLQGSIRALSRSASESSDGHRQVTRLALQGMARSHSTDHLLEGVGQMVSSVHALMCTGIQLQAQEITKNSNEKERLQRSRGPPKRIYRLDALCKDNLSDTEEDNRLYEQEDAGLDGAAEEVTLWNIGACENAKPWQDTPPSPCTESEVEESSSQVRNSSKESKPKKGDSEEDKVLSVADARRTFEASSSSKRKAVACHSKRGSVVELCRERGLLR